MTATESTSAALARIATDFKSPSRAGEAAR